jgi:hypothetical protein
VGEPIRSEEELEATIWAAMKRFEVTCPNPFLFIGAIEVAARHYAAGDSESLAELRRDVLYRDIAPSGHG